MRGHRVKAASVGLSALLLGLAAAGTVWAQDAAYGRTDVRLAALDDEAMSAALPLQRLPAVPALDDVGAVPPFASSDPAGTAAPADLRPFAPPSPDAIWTSTPIDPIETGTIVPLPGDARSIAPDRPAPADPAASADIPLPAPDLPMPVVIDTPVQPAAGSPTTPAGSLAGADLIEALKGFTAPDATRRPGETIAQMRQRQKARDAIATFYADHGNAPLWIAGDRFSAAARSAMARIDHAAEDGLDLRAYPVPVLRSPTAQALAAADLALSEAVVAYAQQASGSRITPTAIDPLITAKPAVADPASVLAAVAAAADPGTLLHGYNPPQPGYAALRAKLAELRQTDVPLSQDSIPSGPTLKKGMRDARVPLIRSRFGLDLPSADGADGLVYDTKVATAVADFQRANGLPASGILTPKTVAALSGGNPSRLENELVANMERWRWVPRDMGEEHIEVNIPDFTAEVVQGQDILHKTRVVVGKPDHQTPVFSDLMRFIIVNPYWNVPLSIIKKEMMPKLASDPNYFANHGYEVVERNGTTYVRQPPGEDNALGRIKFMFPNQHSVYLHDTNARALFGKEKRAFSHGCVRVDQPFKLAEVVLGRDSGWTEAKVKKLIGGDERTIMLPKPLPIHIMYFTAFVDGAGGLQLRDDVYGYSGKVKLALGLQD